MKRQFLLQSLIALCALLFAGYAAEAQTQLADYRFRQTNSPYQEITGTPILAGVDDGAVAVDLGFTFRYLGQDFTQVGVTTNGFVMLGGVNASLGNNLAGGLRGIVAPFWEDLFNVAPSSLEVTTLGAAPNRVFVAQWRSMARCCGAGNANLNFQARLYETSNAIELHYGTMVTVTAVLTGTIGLSDLGNPDGTTRYISISPGGGGVATLSSTVSNNNVDYTQIASGTVYSFSLFPVITQSFPDDVDPRRILAAGSVYDGTDPLRLRPSLQILKSEGQSFSVTYKIIGPIVAGSTPNAIYVATDNGNPNDEIIDVTTGSGLITWNSTSAKGGPVFNAAGANGALNLQNIPGGTYRVIASISIPALGYTQEWQKDFNVSLPNDVAVADIISPYSSAPPRAYQYSLNFELPIAARFQNVGLNTITELEVSAEVRNSSGTRIYYAIDTLDQLNMNTGDVLSHDFPAFNETSQPGEFSLYICTRLLKTRVNGVSMAAQDEQPENNCTPAPGRTYTFKLQHEIETAALGISIPANGASFCSNRPFLPQAQLINHGVADASNIPVSLSIYKLSPRTLVAQKTLIIPDAPTNITTDVFFGQTMVVTAPGQYEAQFRIDLPSHIDPIENNNAVSTFFTVNPALSGFYEVGAGRDFATIQDAVNALYSCGVGGPVTFLLTDAEYTVGNLNSNLPAIDLTSNILGASATNTITWRPADNRIGTRGGVTITLRTGSGIGIQFGQNMSPSNPYSVASEFAKLNIRTNANAPGYMTFDGGQYKALRLRLQTNAAHGHRAVVYIGRGASNYSVANCLVDNAPGSAVSYAVSLPKQVINTNSFTYESDIRTNGATYSAGIVIRNTVPVNRTGNNSEGLDTLYNRNNKIIGNEISGFGYGVVNMGAGVLFQAQAAKLVGYYNEGTQINDNKIWNVARAGIWSGFERNGTISGNRVYNVGGAVGYTGGAAGIMAGGEARFNNQNLTISSNEISGVSSSVVTNGIYVEQVLNRIQHPNGSLVDFPSGNAQMRTYNNTVWGLNRTASSASAVGIYYLTQRNDTATGMNALVHPKIADYFTQGDVIANNTIVMTNDNVNGSGAVVGMSIQHAKSPEVYNNAIAMLGGENTSSFIHAALSYEGIMPGKTGGLKSDYNAFWTPSASVAYVVEITDKAYRTDKAEILSLGAAREFRNLNQWRARTKQDMHSVEGNFFANDMQLSGTAPAQTLRVKTNPTPLGSILNNRGMRISYIGNDIDGNIRGEAKMPYDIGADEFAGRLFVSDMEAMRITSPMTYRRESGLFSEAEYVMTKAPVNVSVLIRNSGSLPQSNVKLTARVYRERSSTAGNPMQPASYLPNPEAIMEKRVTLRDGEDTEITFDFGATGFRPQSYSDLGDPVPGQFATMNRNVTPRYRLEVEVDSDLNVANNKATKEVRFYLNRSRTGMIVSEQGGNINSPSTAGEIAGKLNADSVNAGLWELGDWRYSAGDYDRLERMSWEPYGVDYTSYRTMTWSQDNSPLTRQQREDIRAFLASGKMQERKNLIMGSQEVARLHIGDDILADQAFVNKVLRAQYAQPGTPTQPDYNEKMIEGAAISLDIREILRNTGYPGDVNPRPALVRTYSDATTPGIVEKAYRYLSLDNGVTTDGMGTAVSTQTHNIVFYGVDWRHVGRMSNDVAQSGVQRLLKGALDYFEDHGGWMVPVELASFEARKTSPTTVGLEWTTASERNSAYFEVERREKSDTRFAAIDRVTARGNSSLLVDYTSEDATVQGGRVYVYRLKSVDVDGSYGYSQEVEVDMGRVAENVVVDVQPNPTGERAEVRYTLTEGQSVTVELYAADGSLVQTLANGHREAGSHIETVNAGDLASGQYLVVVRTAGGQISQKLQIVK